MSGLRAHGVGHISAKDDSKGFPVHQRLTKPSYAGSRTRRSALSAQPARRSVDPLLQLQQAIGNRAVGRLLDHGGNQPTLRVSQPGDIYEQEADRIADRLVWIPSPLTAGSTGGLPPVQRKCVPCSTEEEETLRANLVSGHAAQLSPEAQAHLGEWRGGGRPLDRGTRSFFEPRFARDLSRIHVHTDARAADAAQALNALAFTAGQDIVFGRGQYAPRTAAGLQLLAHELAHTFQQDPGSRIARQCGDALRAIPIPSGDSSLTADASVAFDRVVNTPDVIVSPLAGTAHVKSHLPRALQRIVFPRFLAETTIRADISASLTDPGAAQIAARFPGNELCVSVDFHPGTGAQGAGNWYADLRILSGSQFVAPLQLGIGTPTQAPSPEPFATGTARISLRLRNDLTASAGPFQITNLGDLSSTWSNILNQVRDTLALQISNIEIPLDLRLGGGVTVPVTLPSEQPEHASVIPVHVLGDLRLTTDVSTREGGFSLRLSGGGEGTAAAGLVRLELSGTGRLRGTLPSSVRLGDLSRDFLRDLLARSEGGGQIQGRLTAFGLPGRLSADFRVVEGQLVGDAGFVSPLGFGGGSFRYHLSEGLSADLGMVGLVNLTLEPANERLQEEARRSIGPPAYEFGTSVTGLGVTGVRLRPSTLQTLSIGAGPQFITTPTQEHLTGFYGGLEYRLHFP